MQNLESKAIYIFNNKVAFVTRLFSIVCIAFKRVVLQLANRKYAQKEYTALSRHDVIIYGWPSPKKHHMTRWHTIFFDIQSSLHCKGIHYDMSGVGIYGTSVDESFRYIVRYSVECVCVFFYHFPSLDPDQEAADAQDSEHVPE